MILAIDPGFSGAVVILSHAADLIFKSVMPLVGKQLDFHGLTETLSKFKIQHCILEKAQSFPKQGVASAFNYGRHFGHLEGLVTMLKLPYTLVPPSVWTKELHQGIEKELPSKQKSLMAVNRLFPKLDLRANERCKIPHDGIVDALLIAEYGRRKIELCATSTIS